MLKCRDIAHQSSDYIEKKIGWKGAIQFHLHLLICRHCRRFMRQLRLSLRMFSQKEWAASDEEVQKVLRTLESEPSHKHN